MAEHRYHRLKKKYDLEQTTVSNCHFISQGFLRLISFHSWKLKQRPLFKREKQNTKKINNSLAICDKFPSFHLDRASELKRPFERKKKFEKRNRNEIANRNFDVHREVDKHIEERKLTTKSMVQVNPRVEHDVSPKKEMAKITPIAKSKFQRPVHLLHRRLNRGKVYQNNNSRMIHEGLLAFDENMDKLRVFTPRDTKLEVNDFYGKKINTKAGKGCTTSKKKKQRLKLNGAFSRL